MPGTHKTKAKLIEELNTLRKRAAELEAAEAECGRAEEALLRQNEYLAALHDTTLALMRRLRIADLLETIMVRAGQLVGTPHGYIYLARPDEQEIEIKLGMGVLSQKVGFRVKRGEGLGGTVWQTGEPLVVDDYDAWPNRSPLFGSGLVRASVGVPLKSGARVVGVIGLAYTGDVQRTFGKDEVELLSRFAELASIALDNAQLYEQAQAERERMAALSGELEEHARDLERRNRHLQSLNAMSAALMSGASVQEILDAISRHAAEAVGGTLASVLLPDSDGALRVKAGYGLSPEHFGKVAFHPDPNSRNWLAFETGQTVIVNDPGATTARSPERQSALNGLQVRSFVSVPLRARGRSTGLLVVLNKADGADFTRSDTDLLIAFAAQAAAAMENLQLFESAQLRAAELDAVLQASLILTSSLGLRPVLDAIVESAYQLLHGPRDINIFLYQNGRLTFGAAMGVEGRTDHPHSEPRPGGLTHTVAEQGQPIIVPNMRESPMFASQPDWQGAIVGMPLKFGTRVVGVMNFSYEQSRSFSDADLRALRLLGDQAAIAIENARLFEAERTQARRQAALFRLSAEIAATTHEADSYQRVANGLHDEALGYDFVGVFRLDEAAGERVLQAAAGWADAPIGLRIAPGRGVSEMAVLTGQLHYTPDVTKDPRYVSGLNNGSEVDVPLRIGERVIGVLVVESARPNAFGQDDFEALTAAAHQAGIAIGRARLLEAERRRADELEAVRATLASLSGELDLSRVLHAVLERAVALLGVTGGDLAIYDDDSAALVVASHNLERDTTGTHIAMGEGITGCVAQTREPLIVQDYQHWDRRSPRDAGSDTQYRSALAAPLTMGSRLVGVITAVDTHPTRQFGPADLRLLGLFTPQAAIAIEHARLYAAAQQEKQYFEALVLNSPIAIVTLDFDRHIVSCNPAFETLFGYAEVEVIGRDLDELITTDATHDEAVDYTRQAVFGPVHRIGQRRRRDGSLVDVELFGVPVFVEDERVGLLGLYHDITELVRARQEAEAANRSKSQFLANMSHELRTPLNAVIGYGEMLQEEAQDLGYASFVPDLQKITSAGKHLLALINDILDLSKIEAGKIDLYLETFDIANLIEDVAVTVRPLVQKQGNTLTVRCDESAGVMHADATKVRQALFNLLSNAGKFTEHGSITLSVQRLSAAREGGRTTVEEDWIVFHVTDTGIGMSADQVSRLFQPFTQADASTTRKYGGTGLGLTITKRFCQMMGGDVTVETEPGRGSTFTIRLPVEVAEPASGSIAGAETRAGPRLNQGSTVLVIDDDPFVRDLMKRFLGKDGFRVESAASGEEGLQIVRPLHPDAIILDVMMPGLDGWSVLSALKSDPEVADIPVIMVTIVDDKNRGYALGASDYVTKPVDRERLVATLRKYRCEQPPCPILVVEDDASTREMMRRMLAREGWAVREAENGRTALDRVADERPEMILLDLMMPEMDGFEFITEMRKRDEWRGIPVIVVTAKDLTVEDRLRLNGYVESILEKGAYTRDELLAEVRDLVAACVRPGRHR